MPQSLPGASLQETDAPTGPSVDHDLAAVCASMGLIGCSQAFNANPCHGPISPALVQPTTSTPSNSRVSSAAKPGVSYQPS